MVIQSLQTLRQNGYLSPGQPNAAYSGGLWSQTHQSKQHLDGVFLGLNLWPCLPNGLFGSEVEHQRTKRKVAGSSPAEVHFFSCCIQTNQASLGWVWLHALDLNNHCV